MIVKFEEFMGKYFKHILILIIAFLFYHIVTVPLNGNIQLLLGGIFQTEYLSGSYASKLYHAYGRGIGHRFVLYFLYLTNKLFLGEWDYSFSHIFIKSVYYIVAFASSFVFLWINRKQYKKHGASIPALFLLFVFIVLLSTHRQTLEASEMALFPALGMFSFAISTNRKLNYLSGLFIPILFSFKGITLGFAGFPFFFLLYNYKSFQGQFVRFVVSSVVFILITILLYYFYLPIEILFYQENSYYQTAFKFKLTTIPLFAVYALKNISCVPNTFTAYALLSLLILETMQRGRLKKNWLVIVLACIVPFVYVVLQHKWFPYNYVIFLPCVFLLGYYFFTCLPLQRFIRLGILILGVNFMIYCIAFLMPLYKLSPQIIEYCNKCNFEEKYFDSDQNVFNDLNEKYHLNDESVLLNLTSGMSSYFITTKSYFKEINLLVLQRLVKIPEIAHKGKFKQVLKQAMEYNGNYVLIDVDWFDLSLFPALSEKLLDEYTLVESKRSFNNKMINLYKKKNVE